MLKRISPSNSPPPFSSSTESHSTVFSSLLSSSTQSSMASIQFSISPASTSVRSSPFHCAPSQRIFASSFSRDSISSSSYSSSSSSSSSRSSFSVSSRGRRRSSSVRCSLETVGPTVTVGQVTEVDKDTFWPIVKAAGEKTVVLDMYTQWCGPCKIIAPKFQELSEKYLDVVFLKLDCNQDNKPLAKELGIRVVPTFKILKDNKIVKEVTGAKIDDLVVAIEAVRSS